MNTQELEIIRYMLITFIVSFSLFILVSYYFSCKELKWNQERGEETIKLDEEKERLIDLRRYQNYCILGVVGLVSWLFVNQLQDEILAICIILLLIILSFACWFLSLKISEKYQIIGELDREEKRKVKTKRMQKGKKQE